MPAITQPKTQLLTAVAIAATLFTGAPIVMSSPAEAARCGGLNQKPCSVLSGKRPCARGLIHIPFVKCAKTPKIKIKKPNIKLPNPFKGDLKAKAKRALKDSKHVVRILVSMHRCIHGRHEDAIHLARLLKRKQRFDIKRMPVYRNCISRPMRKLRSLGYQSVQLGVAGNAGVVLDGSHEQGIVFSTRGRPYYYQTWGYGFGPTAGASVNISVTANRAAPNRVGGRMPKGSPGHGYVVAGYGTYGGGVGLWFDYNDRQTAISAFGGAGLQGKGFVYTRNTTFQKTS